MVKSGTWKFFSVLMVFILVIGLGLAIMPMNPFTAHVLQAQTGSWRDNFNGGPQQTWVNVDRGQNSTFSFINNRYELHTEYPNPDGAVISYVDFTAVDCIIEAKVQRINPGDKFLAYLIARGNIGANQLYCLGISSGDGGSNEPHLWLGKFDGATYSNIGGAGGSILPWGAGDYTWYDCNIKFAVFGNTLKGKAWKATDSEPAGWQVTATDSSFTTAGVGGLMVVTYHTLGWDIVQAAFNYASLTVLSKSEIWVNGSWAGTTPGTEVEPGKIFGYDAFATIQDGVDAVAASGTVKVASGTYGELITVNKANITLKAESQHLAIIRPPAERTSWPYGAMLITANGVTVDGFEIDGTTVCRNGINAYGASNVTIKNNVVHGAVNAWDGCGILVWDWDATKTVNNATIENNIVYDTGRMGIFCMDYSTGYDVTEGNVISGNTVHDVWKMATEWDDGGGGIQINVGKNCSITNNEVYNVQDSQRGIYMFGSATGNTITGNILRDNPIGIQLWISGLPGGETINWEGGFATSPDVHFNNIYGNTTGVISHGNQAADIIIARNNWWGANDGPGPVGPGTGDRVSANVDYDPWLVLGVGANPFGIVANGTSTSIITADMTRNSNNEDTSAGGHIPDGTKITFTTNKGTVSSKVVDKTTINGKATATLTSSTTIEVADVTAKANSATVATAVFFTKQGTDVVDSKTETISGSGTCTNTCTGGNVTIDAAGEHTVTTAKYSSNPGGTPTFQASGDYYDVHLDSTVGVNSLNIQFCPGASPTLIYYWDGAIWQSASNQHYMDGCIEVTITDTTFPSLAALSGLVFGSGTPSSEKAAVTPSAAQSSSSPQLPETIMTTPARITVKYLTAQPQKALANQSVTILANVVNGGDETGKYTATLKINGQVEETKSGTLSGHAAQQLTFNLLKTEPGNYNVDINGQKTYFTVINSGSTGNALPTHIIFIIAVTFIILGIVITGIFMLRRRTRY